MNRRISILLLSKKSEAELNRRSNVEDPSSKGDQRSENTEKTLQKAPLSDEQVTSQRQTVLSESLSLQQKVQLEKAEKTALIKQENNVGPVISPTSSSFKQLPSTDDELF